MTRSLNISETKNDVIRLDFFVSREVECSKLKCLN